MNAILAGLIHFLTSLKTWSGWSMVIAIGAIIAGRYPAVHDTVGNAADVAGLIATALAMIGHGSTVNQLADARDLPQPPINIDRILGASSKVAPLILIAIMLPFAGCSNLTPNQVYKADKAIYIVADVGATVGVAANKIPVKDVPTIQNDLAISKRNLDALDAWIKLNPNLANVPGVTPPEVTQTEAGIEILNGYILKYSLIAPLPSLTIAAPTTAP